ncbi:fungal hydrophobin [Amylocystis lapponica]|nr:fungal hydrophobin [Amylocystis lapponica]
MFSRAYAAAVVLSITLIVSANPWAPPTTTATVTKTVTAPAPTATTISQCNTGESQCCQSTEAANSVTGAALLGLLGIVLEDVDVLLGLDCSPITVVGGSGICDASPVCCSDNSVGDLISIGCVPITL